MCQVHKSEVSALVTNAGLAPGYGLQLVGYNSGVDVPVYSASTKCRQQPLPRFGAQHPSGRHQGTRGPAVALTLPEISKFSVSYTAHIFCRSQGSNDNISHTT